jgi:CheY-like chemotaxis protein
MDKTTKILIVDDSELIRMKLYHLLKGKYSESNMLFADTIDKAWEILKENIIDVILLDIYLPGRNGADLMSDMLTDDQFKDIPIIVITGTKEDSFVKVSFEKHVYAYLHKPIDRNKLLKVIDECVVKKLKPH